MRHYKKKTTKAVVAHNVSCERTVDETKIPTEQNKKYAVSYRYNQLQSIYIALYTIDISDWMTSVSIIMICESKYKYTIYREGSIHCKFWKREINMLWQIMIQFS